MPLNSVAVTNDNACSPRFQVPRGTSQPDCTAAASHSSPSPQIRPYKFNARRVTRCKSASATETQNSDNAPDPLTAQNLQLATAGIVSSKFQRPMIARVKTDTNFTSLDREIVAMLQLKSSNSGSSSIAPLPVQKATARRSIVEAQDSFREHYRRHTNSSHTAYFPRESLRGAQQSKRSVPASTRHGAGGRRQSCTIL